MCLGFLFNSRVVLKLKLNLDSTPARPLNIFVLQVHLTSSHLLLLRSFAAVQIHSGTTGTPPAVQTSSGIDILRSNLLRSPPSICLYISYLFRHLRMTIPLC